MTDRGEALRCLLMPMQDCNLLVPNSLVAEVTMYRDPDAGMPTAPDWLLGRWQWRELAIPLISFDRIIGDPEGILTPRSRIVVFKRLSNSAKFDYFALSTRDMPRVLPVYPFAFEDEPAAEIPHEMFSRRFLVNGEAAAIPNVENLERAIDQNWVVGDGR